LLFSPDHMAWPPAHKGFRARGEPGLPGVRPDRGGALLLSAVRRERGPGAPLGIEPRRTPSPNWASLVVLSTAEKSLSSLAGLLVARDGRPNTRYCSDRLDGAGWQSGPGRPCGVVGFSTSDGPTFLAQFVCWSWPVRPGPCTQTSVPGAGPSVVTARWRCAPCLCPWQLSNGRRYAIDVVFLSMASDYALYMSFHRLFLYRKSVIAATVNYINPHSPSVLGWRSWGSFGR